MQENKELVEKLFARYFNMSKIGKINISIPEKVKVVFTENILRIEGPLGKKSLNIDPEIFTLNIIDGKEIAIRPKIKCKKKLNYKY